jgi:hypothetical protein
MVEKKSSEEFFESQKLAEEEVLKLLISGPRMNIEHFQGITTIVVEGKIDHNTFSKIKKSAAPVYLTSIHALLELHEIDEKTKDLVNNKNLVRKFTKQMNEQLGCLTIGIQDMDYDGINNLLSSKPSHNFEIGKNLLKTSKAFDMEILLITNLLKQDKEFWLFEDLDNDIELCKNIGFVRFATQSMKKSGNKKLTQEVISNLFPKYFDYEGSKIDGESFEEAKKRHRETCISTLHILEKLVQKGEINSEEKEELLQHVNQVTELISSELGDFSAKWEFYIRGHDLEWFIRDRLKIGVNRFRDSLTTFVKYDHLKNHLMFQSLDQWRVRNNLPELFA